MDNQPENRSQQPTSGPQFGTEQQKTAGKVIKEWFNRYGSSVILPIIALLILAGGIYFYASQRGQQEALPLEENPAGELSLNSLGEPVITEQPFAAEQSSQETGNNLIAGEIIPESRSEGDQIVVKAVEGDGVTNLARRALQDYLRESPQDLSNEHKVYIEDYLKDKVGSRPLEVGEEIGFSNDLIREAVEASLQLDQNSLESLEKYSVLVAWQ
ncbi:MAG: hypothetical protein CO160_00600 [Candidatus Portnoybacteria bacterium CG_4_9_14_3_um_filter_43_11]|uniref:Uncharacterized protein n=1 Tax=Candidatus Portnoybacteria bacterium CG_4_9_14_3_um_filter_43_11 TaxID=1974805 RepID=A0A2M7YM44_9BACT|nr:MAG: hypothetical protein CO160_00600 [Candidatus Portnoybacteria bacterium CG_4_9_14_3_um_filter_43_11]